MWFFFSTGAGHEPVREWLQALPREECKAVGVDILKVQFAWPLGKPLVDHLGDGLWEIRSRLGNRIARTLFTVVDEEIVLLHSFIKKTQKIPSNELNLAKQRKNQYLQAYEEESSSGR